MFPLRVRSYYSLMRGTTSPAQICSQAKKMGYPGLALTDTNNLYGLWPFLKACRQYGITPIVGSEIGEPDSGETITCLVCNERGYGNLCTLISLFHRQQSFDLLQTVKHFAEGLFLLSQNLKILRSLVKAGLRPIVDLGPRPTQQAVRLKNWAAENGLGAVATPACAIGGEDDIELYHLLRAIETNCSISHIKQERDRQHVYGLESPHIYAERFAIWPEVIEESRRIAAGCHFTGPNFGLVMPPWDGEDPVVTLRRRAYLGARCRYGDDLGERVVDRLEHELKVIEDMGFSSYFLVVRNIVHRLEADGRRKKRRICGRGSGAASLVAYCLEITNVCPLKYNLYFERFLNPGRSDPPDMDIDFAWDERDEVLEEVLRDYREHAAMVCNHVFFQPRMAVRETAKAFGMPGYEISRLTKKIPWLSASREVSLYQRLREVPTLRGEHLGEPWPMIVELAERLIGIPRYLSVHPGGVVITPKKICHYVPVENASKGVPVIQWEKDGAEEAGLVKIDLLGNRSLGVIRDCLDSVGKTVQLADDGDWQPEDDERTRNTVAAGTTMGCFYIESPAMRLLQRKAATGDYEQLVLQSSIIRPAANEFVREYVRRLHGGAWQPLHPKLADVLDETFGLMVYQEDVSRVAVHLAGFSHARADGLRKVMSKKDKEMQLADYREEFFAGCLRKKLTTEEIDRIWAMMISFSGYSFCKPHSASYARVSFQAAYLKTYHPAEFMAAVISNGGGYYSIFAYVSEAKRLGVRILPPDVNLSERKWLGKDREIRVGLQAVRDLSANRIECICTERQRGGYYRSPADFFHRVCPAEDEARQLIHCGALDSLQMRVNRTKLLWELACFLRNQRSGKQLSLFAPELPPPPQLSVPSARELLRREYEALGFLCRCHPISLLQHRIGVVVKSKALADHTGQRVRFFGWLLTGKLISTKTGENMEFLTFEDDCGMVETTFFPKTYERYANVLTSGQPYLLSGLVEEDFGAITLTVEQVEVLKKIR